MRLRLARDHINGELKQQLVQDDSIQVASSGLSIIGFL